MVFVLVGGLVADRFPRTLVLQGSNVVSFLARGTCNRPTRSWPSRGVARWSLDRRSPVCLSQRAGPGWAIIADAATYLLATLALTLVRLPSSTPATGSDETASFPGQLREGWTHVRSRTRLWVIIAAFGVINAIRAGAWGVLGR
uniref:Uncharacterized protein n=1 Tax=Janibacter limosus TaxID=53458 RepID=A0AC61U2T8_9MICO|nr:hypothetical protein [Janibacter limosus]